MDRRRFLEVGVGVAASSCLPGFAWEGRLMEECRRRAAQAGLAWNHVGTRVSEEAAELGRAAAEGGVLRIAAAVEALRADRIRFAPAWSRTGSSLVAHILGLSRINPLQHRTVMDWVRPSGRRSLATVAVAVDAIHAEQLVRMIKPERVTQEPLCLDGPELLDCAVDGVDLLVLPMREIPRRVPRSQDDWCGWVLERPFRAFIDAFEPRDVSDLAFALTLFSPGLALSGIAEHILAGPRSQQRCFPTIGPRETGGFLVYREDAIDLLMRVADMSRLEASRTLRVLGRKRPDELSRVMPALVRGFREHGMTHAHAREMADALAWSSGHLHSKAHALSLAVMIQSGDALLRDTAMAYTTASCGGDKKWAWKLVEAAKGTAA